MLATGEGKESYQGNTALSTKARRPFPEADNQIRVAARKTSLVPLCGERPGSAGLDEEDAGKDQPTADNLQRQ